MHHLRLLGLIITFLSFAASSAFALSVEKVPNPRHTNAWVTDQANILSPTQEEELNTMLGELEAQTSVEIALVTLDTIDAGTPKDFATSLFNHWGVGKKGADNGLLVLLVMSERRLEMETGYGLEAVLSDGWLAATQANHMVPHFKKGNFGTGLTRGLAAINTRVSTHSATPRADTSPAGDETPKSALAHLVDSSGGDSQTRSADETGENFASSCCCVSLLLLVLLWRIRKRRRRRRCPRCDHKMVPMPDAEIDRRLTPGHRLERELGSRLFLFEECPECHYVDDLVQKPNSAYKTCPSCSYLTLKIRVEELFPATTTSGGRRRIFQTCLHCDFEDHDDEATPRVQVQAPVQSSYSPPRRRHRKRERKRERHDSSPGLFSFGSSSSHDDDDDHNRRPPSGGSSGRSSGGGGSFGGGRSGGGGAGSSW
ncbi:hypothetical protein DL240_05785 [Lujinxingia litoralis]|uniref:TPM domain-containing protein n=1 Tax=Lujinxingia litoralis TaxID=2211119 RepID=A0A328CB24_9DELT|nr:TPM domain-containing protein [Lujinxingia litoralis]RAL23669.1 hypothetical protein DL240_05785 [Lujinxingia litoralis]